MTRELEKIKKFKKYILSEDNVYYQYAALPYRFRKDGLKQVLLITSRETKRWIIPKGWPMPNEKPHHVAQIEAFEEAGIIGTIEEEPIGFYHYNKIKGIKELPCRVFVYLMSVEEQLEDWPEKSERNSQWFPFEEAAHLVKEPELSSLFLLYSNLDIKSQHPIQNSAQPALKKAVS